MVVVSGGAHLPPRYLLGVVVELVDVRAEGLEVRDDELLAERLRQQHDVTLHTPGARGVRTPPPPSYKQSRNSILCVEIIQLEYF